jgi:hypothetical protein
MGCCDSLNTLYNGTYTSSCWQPRKPETNMDHIEHPAAYRNAIERNIAHNRRIGGQKRWFASTPDAQHLRDWLLAQGEFAPKHETDPRCTRDEEMQSTIHHWEHLASPEGNQCKCRWVHHPLSTERVRSDFIIDMRNALMEWGGLTERQTVAVRNSMARAQERLESREQRISERKAADVATSQHLGTVGERIVLTLTVRHVVTLEGIYGLSYINICNDAAGNVVVYKGSNRFDEAIVTSEGVHTRRTQVTVKATVKAHGERDGVKQTIIARPKVQD